ncbi:MULTISPECIES: T9SS type A sorting domain-containing protein [Flavobacterium]|uniref:T9SS type A sorting domain-containing protein n=1 Tax=Flavobacterium TaxID=237 RepID=UPI001FCC5067|nr:MULTISPECIES: T9SS type A sorting domain-containing protein [Flavobacterium]UOK41988.1 T9SS type A sorting domain-containing protein [Flavobacterium enshiense]
MKKITFLLLFLVSFLSGNAQWTTDTAVNTLVADVINFDQYVVKCPNGSTYVVFWKQVTTGGNFELRVQLLDVNGVRKFGPEGMLISNTVPMSTFTITSGVAGDSKNNLYVSVGGTSTPSNPPIFAYKINQEGNMLWGPNGISVGNGYQPTILPLENINENGNVLISYMNSAGGPAKLQKYTAAGVPVWASPVDVLSDIPASRTAPASFFELSNQQVMLVFHKITTGTNSFLFAQKFNTDGLAQWAAPTRLADKGTNFNNPSYGGVQDGDVVYYGYSGKTGTRSDSFMQRINPDGAIPWGINGVDFDTNATMYETDAQIAFAPGSQYVWAMSNYTPSSQDLRGEYIQKFDKITGARQFTDNAKQVFPVDNNYRCHAGKLQLINDNPFFLITEGFASGTTPLAVKAVLLNSNGDFTWPEQSLPVATFSATKGYITLTKPVNNSEAVVVFTEPKVSGQNRIYAQKFVFPTLGVNDFEDAENAVLLYPNPASSYFNIKAASTIKTIAVYNMLGQNVLTKDFVDSMELNIPTQNWSRGLYTISIETTDNKTLTRKLLKE